MIRSIMGASVRVSRGGSLAEGRDRRAEARLGIDQKVGRGDHLLALRQLIFDTAAEIQACRLLTLDAAHKLDRGDPARVEIGVIKVVGAKMLHNAIDRAIQVFGAKGLTTDTPLE
ncbi:MAG: hypothetical protein HC770_12095, partial [Pseudanabaena sp. CRU_2_10]|nr:hypothetical protein [Pseudanabaena sp. CRU_2_10]